jgi:hypothetical protein
MLRSSIISTATNSRAKKHSGLRKNFVESRRIQDKNIRSSFGKLAKDERERTTSIWDAHKTFFANNKEEEKETSTDLTVQDEDLDNGFFEEPVELNPE